MRILIVPSNDWVYSPTCRLHEVAEILGETNGVYVWHFKLPLRKKFFHPVKNVKIITPINVPTNDLTTYYGLNFVLHAAQFAKVVRKLKIDAVISQNPIPSQWVFSLTPSKTLKIFDMQDYYPESATVYYGNFPSFLKRLLESAVWRATKNCVKMADICLCNTASFMKLVEEAGSKKTHFWPNGVDRSFFQIRSKSERLKKKLGLSSHTLVFFGIIEP